MQEQDLNPENVIQSERKTTGYEFTMAQNTTIQTLADRMKFMGILFLAYAVLVAIVCIYHLVHAQDLQHGVGELLEVILFSFMGWWTYKGADSFHAIVRTKGSDIMHLMDALEDLRKIYNLNFWLMIGVFAILFIAIIVAVIMAS